MIKLVIGNINIKLIFEDLPDKEVKWIKKQIHNNLDPLNPQRYHMKAYNMRDKYGNRLFDGREKVCDLDNNLVPTGLYDELIKLLDTAIVPQGFQYSYEDQRKPQLLVKVPDQIDLKDLMGDGKDITLRDYQYSSVRSAFDNQVGIVLLATNAGKTSVAVSIFKFLLEQRLKDNEKLLFIAPNTSVMNQLFHDYQRYIGADKIGIWGDSKKDLTKPIIVATYQTLNSTLKKPEVKLTKKKDKHLERFAVTYRIMIFDHGDPYTNLKLLALNLKPKYKYQADDPQDLKDIYSVVSNSKQTKEYFDGLYKQYKKLVYKNHKDEFERYDECRDLLNSVVATIVDECQGAGAPSYWNIFQELNNSRMRIGLTGTMPKQDKLKMVRIKALLGTPIANISNDEMIKRGFSAKPHIKMVKVDQPVDLEQRVGAELQRRANRGMIAGDLVNYQLAYRLGVIDNDYYNQVVSNIAFKASERVKKRGKAVMVMVNSLEHGENIAKKLDKLGAKYDYVKGEDDTETREEVLDRVRSGELPIVIATKIFEVGINCPNIQVFIQCSGGKSYVSLMQRIGRILRIQEDKHDVYVFDLVNTNSDILYRQAQERYRQYQQEGFEIS